MGLVFMGFFWRGLEETAEVIVCLPRFGKKKEAKGKIVTSL
jgi:hypothetical protein